MNNNRRTSPDYRNLTRQERHEMIQKMIRNSEALASLACDIEVEAENVYGGLSFLDHPTGEEIQISPTDSEARHFAGTEVAPLFPRSPVLSSPYTQCPAYSPWPRYTLESPPTRPLALATSSCCHDVCVFITCCSRGISRGLLLTVSVSPHMHTWKPNRFQDFYRASPIQFLHNN